jgi:hypothetical protein
MAGTTRGPSPGHQRPTPDDPLSADGVLLDGPNEAPVVEGPGFLRGDPELNDNVGVVTRSPQYRDKRGREKC